MKRMLLPVVALEVVGARTHEKHLMTLKLCVASRNVNLASWNMMSVATRIDVRMWGGLGLVGGACARTKQSVVTR